jgi:hypothetical protein
MSEVRDKDESRLIVHGSGVSVEIVGKPDSDTLKRLIDAVKRD